MTDNACVFPMPNDMLHKPAELRGLTKRGWIASQILAGMCSHKDHPYERYEDQEVHSEAKDAVTYAVVLADLLLETLRETSN